MERQHEKKNRRNVTRERERNESKKRKRKEKRIRKELYIRSGRVGADTFTYCILQPLAKSNSKELEERVFGAQRMHVVLMIMMSRQQQPYQGCTCVAMY